LSGTLNLTLTTTKFDGYMTSYILQRLLSGMVCELRIRV